MKLYSVWIAKFEDGEDFKKCPIFFIDDKTDFSILGIKDPDNHSVIDIETGKSYHYFERDSKNRILPHEIDNIKPNTFFALRFDEPKLDDIEVLKRISIFLKSRNVEKQIQKRKKHPIEK